MKMIEHNHFICHYYFFSVFSYCLDMTLDKKLDVLL